METAVPKATSLFLIKVMEAMVMLIPFRCRAVAIASFRGTPCQKKPEVCGSKRMSLKILSKEEEKSTIASRNSRFLWAPAGTNPISANSKDPQTFSNLLETDSTGGFIIINEAASTYFNRYIEILNRFQGIVTQIPIILNV